MASKEDHPSKMRRLVRKAPTVTPEPALSTVSRIRRLVRKSPEEMAAEAAEKAKAEVAAKTKEPKAAKKPRKAKGYDSIEDYMEALVSVYLQEEGFATSRTVKEKIHKLRNRGKYGEYEEEAILSFGGHDEIAKKVYDYFKKHGHSDKDIKSMMQGMRDEGYSMFNEILDS